MKIIMAVMVVEGVMMLVNISVITMMCFVKSKCIIY